MNNNKMKVRDMYARPVEYCGETIVLNRFKDDETKVVNIALNLELFDGLHCTYNVITLQPSKINDIAEYEKTRYELKQELLKFFDGKRPAMVADEDEALINAENYILQDEAFAVLLVKRLEENIDYIKNETTDRDMREIEKIKAFKKAVAKKITNTNLDVSDRVVNRENN